MIYKEKHKIWLLIIAIVLALTVNIYEYSNKWYDGKNELELKLAAYTAERLYLDIKYPDNDASNIEYIVGDSGRDFFERWELITEVYPEIPYPREAIEQENWEVVDSFYTRTYRMIRSIDKQLEEDFSPIEADYMSSPLYTYLTAGWLNEEYREEIGILDEDVLKYIR
ncbi:hypothetical protein HXA35_19645 [Bacillus sp. A301a_S52]|nr:hypothetical protein [Bacillus sp. A301a_S52]